MGCRSSARFVDPADVDVFEEHVDILQVGARNMQNFALLKAVGQSRRPVLLKRGLSATIEEWLLAAEYVLSAGNPNVILCERGIRTFETATRNTLDLSAVPVLAANAPADRRGPVARHRAPVLVGPMALAGAAVGADGLIIEVHPDPANARSDGDQSLSFDEFGALMDELRGSSSCAPLGRGRPDPAPTERPIVTAGLEDLRDRIDDTDARLADLVQERAALALEVQRRRDPHVHGHDVKRERDLLERAANGTPGPMTPVELTMVFDAVLRASRSVQRRHAQSVVLAEERRRRTDR